MQCDKFNWLKIHCHSTRKINSISNDRRATAQQNRPKVRCDRIAFQNSCELTHFSSSSSRKNSNKQWQCHMLEKCRMAVVLDVFGKSYGSEYILPFFFSIQIYFNSLEKCKNSNVLHLKWNFTAIHMTFGNLSRILFARRSFVYRRFYQQWKKKMCLNCKTMRMMRKLSK